MKRLNRNKIHLDSLFSIIESITKCWIPFCFDKTNVREFKSYGKTNALNESDRILFMNPWQNEHYFYCDIKILFKDEKLKIETFSNQQACCLFIHYFWIWRVYSKSFSWKCCKMQKHKKELILGQFINFNP